MKNRVLRFTYTKDSGDKSRREVITINEPTDLMLCMDISCMDEYDRLHDEDISTILKVLEAIEKDRLTSIYALAEYYGLKDSIKTFKNKGIDSLNDDTKKYEKKDK